jgi:hypothetical protein
VMHSVLLRLVRSSILALITRLDWFNWPPDLMSLCEAFLEWTYKVNRTPMLIFLEETCRVLLASLV